MAQQTYKLSLESRKGYLYAGVESERINETIALAYMKEIMERCRAEGLLKVMIYRDIPAMLTTGPLFYVARQFQEMMKGLKVAFVNPHENIVHEMHFFIMTATEGATEYMIFNNAADAEGWLLA
jgi:hypothetical protein